MFGAFEQMFGANRQIRHAGGSDQQARNLAIKPCWQWRLRGFGMPKCRKAMHHSFLGNWTTPNMSMAATNKSLARNDKSRTWVEPTKKRRSPTGVRRACQLAALKNVGPGTMAAMNKSLARSNKSRTWVEPTKKPRTPSLGYSDRRQNEERAQTKRNRCVLRFFLRSARAN